MGGFGEGGRDALGVLESRPREDLAGCSIPPANVTLGVDLDDARGGGIYENAQSRLAGFDLAAEFRGAESGGGHLGQQREHFFLFIEKLPARLDEGLRHLAPSRGAREPGRPATRPQPRASWRPGGCGERPHDRCTPRGVDRSRSGLGALRQRVARPTPLPVRARRHRRQRHVERCALKLSRMSCSFRSPATVMEAAMTWWSWLASRCVLRIASRAFFDSKAALAASSASRALASRASGESDARRLGFVARAILERLSGEYGEVL